MGHSKDQCISIIQTHPPFFFFFFCSKMVALMVKNLPASAGDIRDFSLVGYSP